MSIEFGPILNLRKTTLNKWTISALILVRRTETLYEHKATLSSGTVDNCKIIASVPFSSPLYDAVRYEFSIPLTSQPQTILYQVGTEQFRFCLPAKNTTPNLAYVSCNGFSSAQVMKNVEDKYNRWRDINQVHQKKEFNILLMGGDQIYSDSIWHDSTTLEEWSNQLGNSRWSAPFTQTMHDEIDFLFFKIYFKNFTHNEITSALSHIPTIMMWDDHDIMDGWGSYPFERHNSEIYQGIFRIAEKYFRIFQLQIPADDKSVHPAALPKITNYSLGYLNMGELSIIVADLRKERSPRPMQIMSESNWQIFYQYMEKIPANGHLLIQSSIPVAYQNLNKLESLLNALPGQAELEDDLRDHWRSEAHIGERKRFIHRLLDYTRQKKTRVTIVSGDVHVGASAVIESTRYPDNSFANNINQLISTGVVHPAPSAFVRYLLETNAREIETIESGITAQMIPLTSKGHYLIGERNWLSIEPDKHSRLWANWHVEFSDHLISRVIHPAGYKS